jgi:Arc/MetJ-type ribon-helix-helix transcriptional regulator
MGEPASSQIEEQVKAAFPEGAIQQVQVLNYGDDPGIEPGQSAIRIFIAEPAPPRPGPDAKPAHQGPDERAEPAARGLRRFEEANYAAVNKLRHELQSISFMEFRFGGEELTTEQGPRLRLRTSLAQERPAPDELTSVMTRLGPHDLATVDTLIAAGIANSRAEVLRWALGRVRDNPAYAEIEHRVSEINALKARF